MSSLFWSLLKLPLSGATRAVPGGAAAGLQAGVLASDGLQDGAGVQDHHRGGVPGGAAADLQLVEHTLCHV